MFTTLIRWISEAFTEAFALMAKLPPQAFRPNYPF
jgi:hypothetical protein